MIRITSFSRCDVLRKPLNSKPREIHLGKNESIYDTAKVLSRFLDGIMIRWNNRKEMQALADIYALVERRGDIEGKKVVFSETARNRAR